jgi:hypothetical protein
MTVLLLLLFALHPWEAAKARQLAATSTYALSGCDYQYEPGWWYLERPLGKSATAAAVMNQILAWCKLQHQHHERMPTQHSAGYG